ELRLVIQSMILKRQLDQKWDPEVDLLRDAGALLAGRPVLAQRDSIPVVGSDQDGRAVPHPGTLQDAPQLPQRPICELEVVHVRSPAAGHELVGETIK